MQCSFYLVKRNEDKFVLIVYFSSGIRSDNNGFMNSVFLAKFNINRQCSLKFLRLDFHYYSHHIDASVKM